MVKHIQKICRQIVEELLSVIDNFVEFALKQLTNYLRLDLNHLHLYLLPHWAN